MKLTDHHTVERTCLNCHGKLNGAAVAGDDDSAPRPGDATLCIYCGHLMMFTADGFREPTAAEMYEMAGDKTLITMSHALKAAWAMTGSSRS